MRSQLASPGISCAISQMWPPGSAKVTVRMPQGRSAGPLSSVTPPPGQLGAHRVHVIDDDGELPNTLPRLVQDLRRRFRRRRGRVQEDVHVLEAQHGRAVVHRLRGQAEDVLAELSHPVKIGNEERYRADPFSQSAMRSPASAIGVLSRSAAGNL